MMMGETKPHTLALDPDDDPTDAAYVAAQDCPKQTVPAADKQTSFGPVSQHVTEPAESLIDVDVTEAVRTFLETEGRRCCREQTEAYNGRMVVEDGRVVMRFDMKRSE